MTPVRVAIIDEHDIFRRGLVACLAADPAFDVVYESSHQPSAVAADIDADVAVVSARAARVVTLGCPVLICQDDDGAPPRSGGRVLAVLPRSTLTERQLMATVWAVAAGLRVDPDSPASEPNGEMLSERSLTILRLLAGGADTKRIAADIGYAERTVKSLIRDIERDLGVRNRTQAVAAAIRRGLLPDEP